MHPWLLHRQIDLVAFEELCLFMFRDDNLYRIVVPENTKNQSLAAVTKRIREGGHPPSPVTPQNVECVTSARYGVFVFLHHLWQRRIPFTVLDIGSFVGTFGLKVASCARTFGEQTAVITFDPTEAGALINYNIELNGLSNWVRYEELAVAEADGLVMFDYRPGYSDSSSVRGERAALVPTRRFRQKLRSLVEQPLGSVTRHVRARLMEGGCRAGNRPPVTCNFIGRSTNIRNYLLRNGIESDLFVKIDIEGLDPLVVDQLTALLPERRVSIVFEFAPGHFERHDAPQDLLAMISDKYHVFDIFYSPNPTRFRLIQPDQFSSLEADVRWKRRYGYTDLFLLDKRTPECAELVNRLASLRELPDAYWLAWPPGADGL